MKIAHIVCAFPPYRGGMGNSAYHFARVLSEQGHEVTVFTPAYLPPKSVKGALCYPEDITSNDKLKRNEKFKVVRLGPWFKYGKGAVLPQLLWRLKGFDVIHLHYPFYGSSAITLLGKVLAGKKTKLIIHYHMDTAASGIKGVIFKLSRYLTLPILARVSKVITCASLDYIKHSDLAEFYRRHPEKFRQTLFGVDSERFYPPAHTGEKEEKTILFVGGLDKAHYFKGLENLLAAFKLLAGRAGKCRLIIVGGGDMSEYYKNLAKEFNIADKVKFAGLVSNRDLPGYYRDCDVFVLPSISQNEAFGLVLLEAMASGKPVIASNLPGVRSVLKSGQEGFLVEPGDIRDLAAKLKTVLTDRETAERMGRAGRELVEKKYNWEEVGKRLNLIYHYAKYTPK